MSDQRTQFTAWHFVRYLRRQGVRHRYGAVAKPQSVARMQRFWLSLKTEFAHPMLCLKSLRRIRSDLADYISWFERHRPHRGVKLRTPKEVFDQRATRKRRNPKAGENYVLTVGAVGGHRSLPTYSLRRVA